MDSNERDTIKFTVDSGADAELNIDLSLEADPYMDESFTLNLEDLGDLTAQAQFLADTNWHRVAVIGAGSWGTALALTLVQNKHQVTLWSNEKEHVSALLAEGENKHFLPGIRLPQELLITDSLEAAVAGVDAVVFAIPSHAMREVAQRLLPFIPAPVILISVAKGFEGGTLLRMSQVLKELFPQNRIAVFSGPSHAEEVGKLMPTAIVAAAEEERVAIWVQELFSNGFLRVYTNDDVIGVEIAAAMKNIIAIGCGICYGCGCGDNTEAAILTRGLAEITRLGLAMGAKETTFSGLAGIGDLVVTCGSTHSRNRRCGTALGKGEQLKDILANMGMVVEGVNATANGHALGLKYGVELPITNCLHAILTNKISIKEAFPLLMNRTKTKEGNQ